MKTIITTSNPKTALSVEYGYLTGILHFASHKSSGKNVCPYASDGCIGTCLDDSGMGRWSTTKQARKERTLWYFNDRKGFEEKLAKEIISLDKKAKKKGLKSAFRLNGTSDIASLPLKFAKMFPEIQFYDYTKNYTLFDKDLPKNYDVTFSRSEKNEKYIKEMLKNKINVAVVFDKIPKVWNGIEVVSGMEHDLRFLDKKEGVIIGLLPKGKAKCDKTGFVVRNAPMIS